MRQDRAAGNAQHRQGKPAKLLVIADEVTPDDLRLAAELVYPPRATQVPQEPDPPEQSPPEEPQDQAQSSAELADMPDDILIDAIAALLPPALLDQLTRTRPSRNTATGSGAGQRRKTRQRGRPLPARPEAKGAVELLLAQAYARRDRVAMIAFRGTTADVILAPTRALAQAKRQLAGLPGGGGTPLASALEATLARQAQGQGLSPAIALLTDARANITLEGQGDRLQAAADTKRLASLLRAEGLPMIVIDTAMRPGTAPAQLASDMGARRCADDFDGCDRHAWGLSDGLGPRSCRLAAE
ncbi:Magnesium-chelatase 60 kDa subunit [Roseovarius gaetbuli]|uniref:Magnesium-chelatase 60 kDa subunit n=1 Tax=Roseovarius gaetbuli TaxID=1356575 RepID=A0A1X6ZPT7_9RHOB|nr:hypothetical protein [Roseovarius gaetbuli]SLN57793.1 Magnesium-chelatase 60 kDa subunit [Roseovarius gaetbuli]